MYQLLRDTNRRARASCLLYFHYPRIRLRSLLDWYTLTCLHSKKYRLDLGYNHRTFIVVPFATSQTMCEFRSLKLVNWSLVSADWPPNGDSGRHQTTIGTRGERDKIDLRQLLYKSFPQLFLFSVNSQATYINTCDIYRQRKERETGGYSDCKFVYGQGLMFLIDSRNCQNTINALVPCRS